ncbi:hypothetical protein H5410_045355 [Solanum commersonii]|uniref:Uncharacterized protein n=1 Tax=Solanum commersonii TaxID=4109 RepID=A0A9J5X9B2_SOLCO|nr:hypothetical protein H5410_045355 [Solanum commersonii]
MEIAMKKGWIRLSLQKFCIRQPNTQGADKGRGQQGRKRKRNDSNTHDEKARNIQHHLVKALGEEWQNGELST